MPSEPQKNEELSLGPSFDSKTSTKVLRWLSAGLATAISGFAWSKNDVRTASHESKLTISSRSLGSNESWHFSMVVCQYLEKNCPLLAVRAFYN
jgi:hypothetical protein